MGASPYTLLVLMKMNAASRQCWRVASSRFTVPMRIHFEIQQRDVRGLVVRGLRGAMDDQVEAVLAEQAHHAFAVANIERARE